MCTVDIKVNDATMRRINPSLTSRDSIGHWLQQRVDELIENYESDLPMPPCSYSRDEMIAVCDRRMDDILTGRSTTIPHDEVMRRMAEKHGLTL